MTGMVSRVKGMIYAVIALVVGGLAYAVGVGSLLGQRAEAGILEAARFTYDPPPPLSLVSLWSIGIALLLLVVLAWALHGFTRALSLAVFGVAAIAASQLLKEEVLSRPALFDLDAPNTFPSGHMTVFAVLAGALIWGCSASLRGVAALLGATAVGVVAWQLLEFGWHRPSDVVGALALSVLAFALAVILRPPRGARTVQVSGSLARATNSIIGVLLTLSGLALIVGGAVMMALSISGTSNELLLSGAQFMVIGTGNIAVRMQMALAA